MIKRKYYWLIKHLWTTLLPVVHPEMSLKYFKDLYEVKEHTPDILKALLDDALKRKFVVFVADKIPKILKSRDDLYSVVFEMILPKIIDKCCWGIVRPLCHVAIPPATIMVKILQECIEINYNKKQTSAIRAVLNKYMSKHSNHNLDEDLLARFKRHEAKPGETPFRNEKLIELEK